MRVDGRPMRTLWPAPARDGLFVIDLDDRVLRWNRRLEQMFQFDRTRAIGRRISATELKELLAGEIARIMTPVAKALPLYPNRPQGVAVVGLAYRR